MFRADYVHFGMKPLTDILSEYFKKPPSSTKDAHPEGVCPNCWGEQEYDNVIRELYKDKQIDVNNHEANYAFIQKFVVNKIDGITLRKGDNGYVCPTCHLKQEE